MRPHRLLTIGLVAAALLGLTALPARAGGPGGWVDTDDDEDEIEVGAGDGDGTGSSGGGGGAGECSWEAISDADVDAMWGLIAAELGEEVLSEGEIEDPLDYDWYWRVCPDDSGGTVTDLIPVPKSDPVDPQDLLDEAVDLLNLPSPAIATNPPEEQVVQVASWLWIDDTVWRTHSKSVSAGGVTTTATASPRRVIWDLGNGDTVVCDGPGVAYDPSKPADEQSTDCSYTYRHTSAGQPDGAYHATATIEWEVSWTVTGAPGGGALDPMTTSTDARFRVAELQALNQ